VVPGQVLSIPGVSVPTECAAVGGDRCQVKQVKQVVLSGQVLPIPWVSVSALYAAKGGGDKSKLGNGLVLGQVLPIPGVSVPAVCAVMGRRQVLIRRGSGTWTGASYPWGLCSCSVCT
jgi:hypothetical protein